MKRLAVRLVVFALILALGLLSTACGTGASSTNSGANAVAVSLTQSGTTTTMNAGSPAVTLTASVSNDTTNAGVTWSLSPSTGCGTMTSSGTTATYTSPAESTLTASCTATVTTSAAANTSKTAALAFTVKPVGITIPNGESATQAATAGVSSLTLSAALANDASGSATLNWTISGAATSSPVQANKHTVFSARSFSAVTSTCGSLSASTGTSVTYTAPVGLACTATIKASTSVNPSVAQTFTINVSLPVLTASVAAANKVYDGTNTATINGCTLAGVLAADAGNVSCSAAAATFANGNAGAGKAVTATGIALSGTAAGNYALPLTTASTTASITTRPLTVTAAVASKIYDGTASSSAAPVIISGTLAGSETATFTQAYDNKNVGSAHVLTPSGTVNDGNSGNNYTVTFVNVNNGAITARALTITAAPSTKIYDATTTSSAVPTITVGSLVGTDAATFTQAFDNKSVGATHVLTPAGTVSDGNGGNNYSKTFVAINTGVISAQPLTASVTAANKVYDGTSAASISNCALVGVLAADTGNVTCSPTAAAFTNGNAGAGKTVTATGITLSGTAVGNYTLPLTTATTTASITTKAITVTAAASTKTYDSTTSSAGVPTITTGTLVGADTATFTQTYDNKNVGAAHVLTPAGTISDGNGGNNYTVTFANLNTGVITAKALTVTAAASTKAYDGTIASSGVPTITAGSLVGADTATFTQAFDNKNVGVAHVLTPAGTVSDGNAGNNYGVTFATLNTGVITAKSLTASVTAANKSYDGANTATISGCSLVGVLAADTANVACSAAAGNFASANVGLGKTVTAAGITLSGAAAGNYTLPLTTATTTANITTRALTVTAAPTTKSYDGTTASGGVPTITAGTLAGTDTAAFTQSYDNKNVGAAHVLTPTGAIVDGNGGNNYAVTFANFNTGVITVRPLTVTAAPSTKIYDATTTSSGVPTITAGSLVGADTATFTQTFDSKNPGVAHVLTPVGAVSDGNGGSNYAVTFANLNTGVITAKPLTAGVTAANKAYDATNTASIGACTLVGVLAADANKVSCSATAATFADAGIGVGKTVTATGIVLSGTESDNYTLPLTTATGTASITTRSITVTAVASSKIYDGATSSIGVPTITAGSLVGTDTATFTQSYDNKNVGTTHVLTPSGTVSDGNSGNNYSVTLATINTGTISAKALTVTGLSAFNKVYDGTNIAALNGGTLVGVVSPDAVILSGAAAGNFIQSFVGTAIPVNANGISITGLGAGNYTLTPPAGLTANITQKSLTVAADNKTMAPGAPVPPLTVSYLGFVNGETSAVLGGLPILSTTATSASPAGTYPITVTQGVLFSTNYSFNFQPGILTINPAIFVNLSPNTQQTIDAGHSLQITPTVANDGALLGVNLSLNPLTGCGTLSAGSTPSGTAVTYSVPAQSNFCSATITATSISDNTKSASVSVNVNPTLNLPPNNPNPLGSATTNQSYTGFINAVGGTLGYTFNVNNNAVPTNGFPVALTNGLSVSSNGGNTLTISGTPATTTTVPLTVTVQDATGATSGPIQYSVFVTGPGFRVSGNVFDANGSGPIPGVTVTLGTTPTQQTTTDPTGNFSFQGIPDGPYTISASITAPGVSSIFFPASQNITVSGADRFVTFGASLGYTVSGTVAYGGSKTGTIYIALQSTSNCFGSTYGTSISSTTLSSGGNFTIKGVCPGTFTLNAFLDNVGLEARNGSNPTGSIGVVTVPSGTSLAVTLTDPLNNFGGLAGPKLKGVSPMSGGVVLQINPVVNGNSVEMPERYRIEWSPDQTFVTGVNSTTVLAMGGDNPYILSSRTSLLGFTDGASLFFRIRGESKDGLTKTLFTTAPLAVIIGAVTPANPVTVQGNANFLGAATTGPLYVGCFDQNTGKLYGESFASAPFPQHYSLAVEDGTNCFMFGIVDNDRDGVIGAGDPSNTDGQQSSGLIVSGPGPIAHDIDLPVTSSVLSLTTTHSHTTFSGVTNENYSLFFDLRSGVRMANALEVISGPNVLVPTDVAAQQGHKGGQFQYSPNLGNSQPTVGDSYGLKVFYSDGTNQVSNVAITTVLNAFAQNLTVDTTTSPATPTTPTFKWSAPAAPPAGYVYQFRIDGPNGTIWQVPGNNSNANGLDSSVTSVVWGQDPTDPNNTPTIPNLAGATTYRWTVTVQDTLGNQTQEQVEYILP